MSVGAGIDRVCSRAAVRALADTGVLARGAAYASQGRVERLAGSTERVAATVRGSMPYAVELRADGDELAWSCSCPAGEDGTFCKHCAAVALTLDPEGPDALFDPDEDEDDVGADPDGDRLVEYVERLDHERLVALVVEQAGGDWRLRERLLAEAAVESGGGVELAGWQRRLETAFDPGGFVAYAEAAAWAREVAEALDGLEDLLDAGQSKAVVELAEQAHRLAEDSLGSVDDPDGWLRDIAGRIGELHLRACEAARPDPVALAGRLVALELGGELEAFHRAAARYAPVLGTAGLAEYRRLLAPRFDALPTGRGPLDGGFTERFRVREAMVGVALGAGDVDELVAVKARHLATPDDYREVASALADAGRIPEAIEWAEHGLAAFPDRPGRRRRCASCSPGCTATPATSTRRCRSSGQGSRRVRPWRRISGCWPRPGPAQTWRGRASGPWSASAPDSANAPWRPTSLLAAGAATPAGRWWPRSCSTKGRSTRPGGSRGPTGASRGCGWLWPTPVSAPTPPTRSPSTSARPPTGSRRRTIAATAPRSTCWSACSAATPPSTETTTSPPTSPKSARSMAASATS